MSDKLCINPNVKKTLLEMLYDRNYSISEYGSDCLTASKDDTILKVFFLLNTKIGIKNINIIYSEMESNNIHKAIIIYSDNISAFAKQLLDDDTYDIELFHEDELTFNITHHNYVPKHEIISSDVKDEILKIYNINEKQLPYILSTDPVCKYFNGKPGDVFRITRNFSPNQFSIYYRLCV